MGISSMASRWRCDEERAKPNVVELEPDVVSATKHFHLKPELFQASQAPTSEDSPLPRQGWWGGAAERGSWRALQQSG